nr:putative cytochrome p450 cyp13a6 [Quercus suber]
MAAHSYTAAKIVDLSLAGVSRPFSFAKPVPIDTDKQSSYLLPEFGWNKKYEAFRQFGSDMFIIVAPGANNLQVADAEAISQITARRNDFPKPTWMYKSVDLFGKNVVSTEGAVWRHHRKITSPPFTEKNNHMVWQESLHQAQSMVTSWVGPSGNASGPIWSVAESAMRLSLHVISRAGFGERLTWPHEESEKELTKGHTLSFKEALETVLHKIVIIMLFPKFLLNNSPFQAHKAANRALIEWRQYMKEMYAKKTSEVQSGATREGMDLMGALVKGAGITSDSGKPGKTSTKQLLTEDEILGNAFVFILAGHETAANTIHFALMYLAMRPSSQRHLQEDLDKIFGDRPTSEWNYDEDVPKLFGSMCGAVMNEELRLIPPVVGIPKCTLDQPQGLTLGGRHVTVPANCYITLSTPSLHRNPKLWPHTSEEDLLEFRPERWLLDPSETNNATADDEHAAAVEEGMDFDGPDTRPDTAASLFHPAKGAYIPFSDGYRSCIGRRFAQVEILAVLATIMKNYSVELDVSMFMTDAELETASPQAKKEVWMKAVARSQDLLKNAMQTIITIQMRKGQVPMRFVPRGEEKFPVYV